MAGPVPAGRPGAPVSGTARPAAASNVWAKRLPALRPLGSVRARATLAAALTVGAALAGAGVLLVYLVHRAELRAVRSDGRDELAAVVTLARQEAPAGVLPTVRNTALVQVVAAGGRVVASSSPAAVAPMAHLAPPAGQEATATVARLPLPADGPFLVYAARVARPPGGVAYVAGSLRPVNEATDEVTRAVAIGAPLLVVLVAVLTWLLTGRALAPVESIRAEVAYISEQALDRRVPEPDSDDEIGRLARTMNAMLQRLDDAVARQHRFVADSSHELRSPLAALLSQIDVAIAHPETAPPADVLAALRAEGERLGQIIDDLLLLARADEGLLTARRRLLDLDDVVGDEVARLRSRSPLRVDTSNLSAAQLFGDSGQLVRLVRNLLDNAARHAHQLITIELREEPDAAMLVVGDDGAGVAAEDRERIFERFTRLDGARQRSSGGSGLGLAIVRQIATAHGGIVEVFDNRPGARFVVRLPLGPPDTPATAGRPGPTGRP